MYLVQKNHVRWQSLADYKILLRLARLSKNVYNTVLWHVKNHYAQDGSYLRYEALYSTMKHDKNYAQLPSQTAQQSMKMADRAIHSFFKLLELKRTGKYTEAVDFPHYQLKCGYYPCVFPKQSFKILSDGNTVRLSLGRYFTIYEGQRYLFFMLPKHLIGITLKEVRLIPQWEGKAFDVEYVYKARPVNVTLNSNYHLAIDLGLNNFATCVSSTNFSTSEPTFILEGRGLKSWNRWWNKEWSHLQSIKDKQKRKKLSNQEEQILQKRRSITKNYVFQAVNHVIKYCLIHEIGSIIIGELPDFKRKSVLGKKNNQHFQAIPIGKFKQQLQTKCEYYGITYTEINEAYTSQTCSQCTVIRKANRLHRGLYVCIKCGLRLNADVNSAVNIGSKVASKLFQLNDYGSSGLVDRPKRIRLVMFKRKRSAVTFI